MKRYELDRTLESIEESTSGEWVRYEDAKEAVEEWHAAATAEGKAKLRSEANLRAQERATQQLSAEVSRLQAELDALKAKFAGPRCEVCGNLCIDLAKDEDGQCPDCSQLAREIAAAGVHP